MDITTLFSLAGSSALVTGGTSGIGEMIARGLLVAGARVTITGRAPQTCKEKAAELSAFGACDWIAADLSGAQGIKAVEAAAHEKLQDLNILVNNAGMSARAPLGEFPEFIWRETIDLNLIAPFMLIQALYPVLKRNASPARPAQVVNTGSAAGLTTAPALSEGYAYGASKAGLHHLTRILARKLAADHINVNAIAPGVFPSKLTAAYEASDPSVAPRIKAMIPVGRAGQPEDMARLVVAIASNGYLTGAVIPIDGGLSLSS